MHVKLIIKNGQTMLCTNVDTPTELMSIALQAEREAIRRYKELSALMHEANNESAAALFDRMVTEEIGHERLLLKWMARESIIEDNNIEPVKWTDPQVATDYNDEACSTYHSTPYRALAFAVHNEEIAFRFYTHVAANAPNAKVQEHAEILAREELGHAALLRAERRKAYHAERNNHKQEPRWLDASAIHSEVDLLTAAIHIDRDLLEQMKTIKSSTPQIETLLDASQNAISEHETTLRNKAKNDQLIPSEDITAKLKELKSYNLYMQQKLNPPGEISRLWACCDRSFAFYDMIVTTTDNEKLMLRAQQLTSVALDRIGFLKTLFGDDVK